MPSPSPTPLPPIPAFYLYGEPVRSVAEGFVHVEALDDRSRPSEWTIRPHVHRDLNHIILIAEGGGSMRAEGDTVDFTAPCMLLIPAGVVHGFTWHRESRGWVTTIADIYLSHLLQRDPDLIALFRRACAVALPPQECALVEHRIERLAQELGWSGRGRRAAVESLLLWIMVHIVRVTAVSEPNANLPGRQAMLVARLRDRIEQRFRLREPVAAHARALSISESALRQACVRVAAAAPATMLDDRTFLEACRLLLYSNLSVTEIAYAVGFDDPAYFSRFFVRRAGMPPRAYRANKEQTQPTNPV